MAKWKVWNKHPTGLTHREKFREEMIEIPAGKFVTMDYEDAVLFKGQYYPMKKRADGADDPAGYKVLSLEPMKDGDEVQTVFTCHLDGKKFNTQTELDAYLKANYADRTFTDDALEEEIAKSAPKRGRPAKDKSA